MARRLLFLGGIDTLRIYFAGPSARISLEWDCGSLGAESVAMKQVVEQEEHSPFVSAVELLKESSHDSIFNANNPFRSGFVLRRA